MEKILKHQFLFFGFYNKNEVDFDVNISVQFPKDIKFALIEIKNGYLFERNMMQPIDWALVKEFKTYVKSNDKKLKDIENEVGMLKDEVGMLKNEVVMLKNEVGMLKYEVGMLKNEVGMLKTEIKQLSEKMNNFINLYAPKKKEDESNDNIIGKKIKRNKK